MEFFVNVGANPGIFPEVPREITTLSIVAASVKCSSSLGLLDPTKSVRIPMY